MFERLSRSWALTKAGASVLNADKELMIFPALSALAFVLLGIVFFVPFAFLGFDVFGQNVEIVGYVVGFLYYLGLSFIGVFFNSALVGAALIRLDGGDPTVADGLRIARERIGLIFRWSLLAASVGMLLKVVRERSGAIGGAVTAIIGIGWNLATFLVVPVLVTRNLGPIDALKESAALLKKTWGEQIIGNAGIGLVFTLIGIVYTVGVVVPLVFLFGSLGSGWGVGIVLVLAVSGYALIALVSASLSGIYSAALYRYATTGQVGYMDPQLLANAFRPK